MRRPLGCDHHEVCRDSPVSNMTTLGRLLSCLSSKPERERASRICAVGPAMVVALASDVCRVSRAGHHEPRAAPMIPAIGGSGFRLLHAPPGDGACNR